MITEKDIKEFFIVRQKYWTSLRNIEKEVTKIIYLLAAQFNIPSQGIVWGHSEASDCREDRQIENCIWSSSKDGITIDDIDIDYGGDPVKGLDDIKIHDILWNINEFLSSTDNVISMTERELLDAWKDWMQD